jgi:hypothetical protein
MAKVSDYPVVRQRAHLDPGLEGNMVFSAFTSRRVSSTGIITLDSPLREVFPLFGPIREREWAVGWDPQILYSTTDLVEEHMVFKTPSHHGHGEPDCTWTVSKYVPDQGLIEYTVFTPERLWWITIQCCEDIPNQTTEAEITYTYTGLTDKGNAINEKALQLTYAHDLRDWEEAINHYLKTGERREHH